MTLSFRKKKKKKTWWKWAVSPSGFFLRKEYISGEMKHDIFGILFLPQDYLHRRAARCIDVVVPYTIMLLLLLIWLKHEFLRSSYDYWVTYGPFAPAMILFLVQVYRRPIVFCFPDDWIATHQKQLEFFSKQGYPSVTMELLCLAIAVYLLLVIAWVAVEVAPFLELVP